MKKRKFKKLEASCTQTSKDASELLAKAHDQSKKIAEVAETEKTPTKTPTQTENDSSQGVASDSNTGSTTAAGASPTPSTSPTPTSGSNTFRNLAIGGLVVGGAAWAITSNNDDGDNNSSEANTSSNSNDSTTQTELADCPENQCEPEVSALDQLAADEAALADQSQGDAQEETFAGFQAPGEP